MKRAPAGRLAEAARGLRRFALGILRRNLVSDLYEWVFGDRAAEPAAADIQRRGDGRAKRQGARSPGTHSPGSIPTGRAGSAPPDAATDGADTRPKKRPPSKRRP